jgi:LysM repeat protein
VSVSGLKRANGLRSDRILAGQTLAIPGAPPPPASPRKRAAPDATPQPPAQVYVVPTPTPSIESTVSPW